VADGSERQHGVPAAGWWAWVVFAAACLTDLAVQGRDRASLNAALALALVTGCAYACGHWPRIVADAAELTVRNPLREHRVPWSAVTGIRLGHSVQITCTRPQGRRPKTVHSWALYAQRPSAAGAAVRTLRGGAHAARRPPERRPGSARILRVAVANPPRARLRRISYPRQ